jgi:hypothetical protein
MSPVGFLAPYQLRQLQAGAGLPVGELQMAGPRLILTAHVEQEHREEKGRQHQTGLPVHRHQREGGVDQVLSQVVGVAAVAEEAVLDRAGADLQGGLFLGIAAEVQEGAQQIQGNGSGQQGWRCLGAVADQQPRRQQVEPQRQEAEGRHDPADWLLLLPR